MDQGLRIRARCNIDDNQQVVYRFVIVPQGGPMFSTMLYCFQEDREKNQLADTRKHIARRLRERHTACWQRYHEWKEKDHD